MSSVELAPKFAKYIIAIGDDKPPKNFSMRIKFLAVSEQKMVQVLGTLR